MYNKLVVTKLVDVFLIHLPIRMAEILVPLMDQAELALPLSPSQSISQTGNTLSNGVGSVELSS